MKLSQFKDIFDLRHEFDDEDLKILRERWPNVIFFNIPTAWIVPIDELLCKLRYTNPIYEVRQEYGHLIILSEKLNEHQQEILDEAEKLIYLIDADIHENLEKSNIFASECIVN